MDLAGYLQLAFDELARDRGTLVGELDFVDPAVVGLERDVELGRRRVLLVIAAERDCAGAVEEPGRLRLRIIAGGQALDEAVEQGLGLAVDPVQILEDDDQRLDLALAQQQALGRVERLLAPLERIELIGLLLGRPGKKLG